MFGELLQVACVSFPYLKSYFLFSWLNAKKINLFALLLYSCSSAKKLYMYVGIKEENVLNKYTYIYKKI